jgi:hypothetical protein
MTATWLNVVRMLTTCGTAGRRSSRGLRMKVTDRSRIGVGQRTATSDRARAGGVFWRAGRKHETVKSGQICMLQRHN